MSSRKKDFVGLITFMPGYEKMFGNLTGLMKLQCISLKILK